MRVEVKFQVDRDHALEEEIGKLIPIITPALVVEAEKIRTASMEIVPIDQGILRNSALEVGTNVTTTNEKVEVMIGYGGSAASYALLQHETPPSVFSHTPGKSWKYLERPSYEAIESIRENLTAAVVRAFEGGGAGTGETFE